MNEGMGITGVGSYHNADSYEANTNKNTKEEYSKVFEQYVEQLKEKIKSGETEPSYQIGGQSFTEEEWKKLIAKMDKNIECIAAEQEARAEMAEKKLKKEDIAP